MEVQDFVSPSVRMESSSPTTFRMIDIKNDSENLHLDTSLLGIPENNESIETLHITEDDKVRKATGFWSQDAIMEEASDSEMVDDWNETEATGTNVEMVTSRNKRFKKLENSD